MEDIYKSLDLYTKAEMLTGENKYHAGHHGKQDAEKGLKFK